MCVFVGILPLRGSGFPEMTAIQFTIIISRQEKSKSYIILGIMLTYVTKNTRYRVETGKITIYFDIKFT